MKKLFLMILLALPVIGFAQKERDENNKEILIFAEQMPEFPGGVRALYQYLGKNIRYPLDMRKQKVEAKVIATFVVDAKGRIKNIEVVNKVPQQFADETIRVLKRMPVWIPGKQNGKPVNVKYTLPVDYRLN
jgi:TonB family protein